MSRMFAACKWHRQATETLGIMYNENDLYYTRNGELFVGN